MTQGAKRGPGRARSVLRWLSCPLGIAILALLPGCGQQPVATVNGEPITRDQFFQATISSTRGAQQNVATGMQILEAMIGERLLLAEAKREGVLPTDAEVDQRVNEIRTAMQKQGVNLDQQLTQAGLTVDSIRQDMRLNMVQLKLFTKGINVSDAEVQKFYDQNKASQFSTPALAKIRHMTLATEKQASEAHKDLRNADFGLVAMSRSIDIFKDSQGQVPQAIPAEVPPNGPIAPAVARKAFTMKKGETSEPMKVGNQWVIIKVDDLIPAKTQPFAEVKEDILRGLQQQKATQSGQVSRVAARLQQLRQQADIGINIPQYKNATAFKQQPAAGIPGMPAGAGPSPGRTVPAGEPPAGASAPPTEGAPASGGPPPAGAAPSAGSAPPAAPAPSGK